MFGLANRFFSGTRRTALSLQASRHSEAEDDSPLAQQRRAAEERKQAESLRNPTPAMLDVIQKMEERERERENMTWQQQLQHLTVSHGEPLLDSWSVAKLCRALITQRSSLHTLARV
jgi:hypothetical protein